MKLEINLTKGKFWALMAVGILLVGMLVYAAASTKPNPGHDVSEVGGLDDKINSAVKSVFTEMEIVEHKATKGVYETPEPFECDQGKIAIGCSVLKTVDEKEEDVGGCRVQEDKSGCEYTWDVSGDNGFAGTDNALIYCYCI